MIHPGTQCPALLISSEVIWGSNTLHTPTLHTPHYSLRTPSSKEEMLYFWGCAQNHIRGLLVTTGFPYGNRISRSFKVHRHQCDPNNLPIASGCVDETCMQNAGTAEQLCLLRAGPSLAAVVPLCAAACHWSLIFYCTHAVFPPRCPLPACYLAIESTLP